MSLLNSHVLKPESVQQIEKLGPLAERIADRWAGGWPKRVKSLEKSGKLLQALTSQVEREKNVLAATRNMSHLAEHEIMELYGVSPEPPEV